MDEVCTVATAIASASVGYDSVGYRIFLVDWPARLSLTKDESPFTGYTFTPWVVSSAVSYNQTLGCRHACIINWSLLWSFPSNFFEGASLGHSW